MSRSPTTQDISWFLDLSDKGQLNLDPPYQRRSVWAPRDRRYFIDTILNNYPAPPIFLHKTLDDNGRATYHVVDGKQRLQTIIMFRANQVSIPDDFSDVNLQNKRWRDLEKATRERFWNYILIVEMLPDAQDAVIRNTFARINRNSRKLSQQEMRHAKYDGWFISAVEAEANNELWKTIGIATAARAKRMADVQFISEIFAVIIQKDISGFDQDNLDQIYADYDELDGNDLFIEEDFVNTLEKGKLKISRILDKSPHLRDYLKIQGNFYTIWSLLILYEDRLPDSDALAGRYEKFMDAVNEQLANPYEYSLEEGDQYSRSVVEYATNLRGANTDKAQRRNRCNALLAVISEPEGI
jgi:Protein of unknown function DUF262